jgi:hypothetical protein
MNALAIRATLKSTGAKGAETQLALIGDNQGDEQLALVVAELSPGEIGLFLENADYTKPSLVTPFVTPAQLIGALERIGAKWGDLRGSSSNALINLKREISDVLFPVLLQGEPAHRAKLLAALLKNSLMEDLVVSLPLFEPGCPEFLADFESNHNQQGTWQEVYADLHALDEKAFAQIRSEVLSLFPDAEENPEDADPEDSRKAVTQLQRTLQALANRAAKLVEASPVDAADEDPFETVT